MNLTGTYFLYLGISIAITVWVAQTLHSRGRVFLEDIFQYNEKLVDSVNDLLVVGFYLVNLGYVTLALKYGTKPHNFHESIEFLATKIGWVLLILGAMHFFNLYVFTRMARNREQKQHSSDDQSYKRVTLGGDVHYSAKE